MANLDRPKIKIMKTKMEWVWDIIGYSFYLGSILFLIVVWGRLPAEVPGHFNAAGEVNRWGSKWELVIMPVVGVFILLLMQALEKHPEIHNYPQRLNESNAEQFYMNSRKLCNQMKNICLIMFALLTFEMVSVALGWEISFGILWLPFVIIATGVPIILAVVKQTKIK